MLRGAMCYWCALDHSQMPSSRCFPRPRDLLGHQNRTVCAGRGGSGGPAGSLILCPRPFDEVCALRTPSAGPGPVLCGAVVSLWPGS